MIARTGRFLLALVLGVAMCGGLIAANNPGVRLDAPFVKQQENACGAASIAMVMQYWQRQQGRPANADAEEIKRTLYSAPAHGIYATDMERYFREHDYREFAFRGEWQDLREHLEKGRPLIVALKSGGDLHYVVVTGMDWENNLVLKNDPAERQMLKQSRSDFEKQWKNAGNWTLLAVPGQNGPSSSN